MRKRLSVSTVILTLLAPALSMQAEDVYNWNKPEETTGYWNGIYFQIRNSDTGFPSKSETGAYSDFRNQDLSGRVFQISNYTIGLDLSNAKFDNAIIANARFLGVSEHGFTKEMLYATKSYADKNLNGISFAASGINVASYSYSNLSGWDFSGQSLRYANFTDANLSSADFSGAVIDGANFSYSRGTGSGLSRAQLESTQSYISGNLSGINVSKLDLTGISFDGKNLSDAVFYEGSDDGAVITGASFNNAIINGARMKLYTVVGARFQFPGLTAEQLAQTQSYKNKDLRNVDFFGNGSPGEYIDFSKQRLDGAKVVVGGSFGQSDFSGADMRGAQIVDNRSGTGGLTSAYFASNGQNNVYHAILSDGSVYSYAYKSGTFSGFNGIRLEAGFKDEYRNVTYDGTLTIYNHASVAVNVQDNFVIKNGAVLDFRLDGNEWNKALTFTSAAENMNFELSGKIKFSLEAGVTKEQLLHLGSIHVIDWASLGNEADIMALLGLTNDTVDSVLDYSALTDLGLIVDTSSFFTTGDLLVMNSVPEPSAYASILVIASMATIALKRRRRQVCIR